jgi:hypothetical protein
MASRLAGRDQRRGVTSRQARRVAQSTERVEDTVSTQSSSPSWFATWDFLFAKISKNKEFATMTEILSNFSHPNVTKKLEIVSSAILALY